MKKLVIFLALAISVATAAVTAQTVKQKVETDTHKSKVKPTTTMGDKVHNVFSKHKRHHGSKFKSKNKRTNAKTKVEVTKKP